MTEPLIFDGSNLYEPELLAREGFECVSIGRPAVLSQRAAHMLAAA
jgi:UDPglucose 6-dehydrogenase